MPVKLLVLLFLLISNKAIATDFAIHGTTYKIVEESFLKQIDTKLKLAQEKGIIKKWQEDTKNKTVERLNNFGVVEGVGKTTTNRDWLYDPSVKLDEDLKDQRGRVFYKAGTKVNPLDVISLSKALIFINGNEK